jgi:hypothetical protein
MMKIYDLYGLNVDNIESAKLLIESVVGVRFELRDSMYIGDYYLSELTQEENYVIRYNYYEPEGWEKEQYKDFKVLFYANCPKNPEELHRKMSSCSDVVCMLHRTIITETRWARELRFVNGQFEIVSEQKLPDLKQA